MRSYNNLYEPMCEKSNIEQKFKDAAKGKTSRDDVKEALENLDKEADTLKRILDDEMFIPDFHKVSVINESTCKKTRRILKPNYKYEQVVHHLAIGQFKEVVMQGLYEFSCGSIPKRGVHFGKRFMKKWIASYQGKKMYVLKMDIHHFFESIDRKILKNKLREVIRDNRFYRLLCILIEHDRIAEVVENLVEYSVEMSSEDVKCLVSCMAFDDAAGALNILKRAGVSGKLFETCEGIIKQERKGVPLGYYTSQWFGNFYLKRLDHYIKQELQANHYMRYMDDMVILSKNKKTLHKIQKAIEEYMHTELNLELKEDWQVFRFEYVGKDGIVRGRMIDFMGFQFHHDRTTMRKSTIQRARRKALNIAKKDKISWYVATQMLSYMGWFKHTDTYNFYLRYIKPYVNVKKLKKIVSKHQRKENKKRENMETDNRNAAGASGRGRQGIVADNGVLAS